ncbi:helix-turn-helix domain-containing protein [Streptococcus mutans]|nr:helix-turn-helix domain-containing protein [Streptococcus mutans]
MRVTDKAVSKWERDLSFPDINSIPKLAEIFEMSVDDLMQVKTNTKETIGKNK